MYAEVYILNESLYLKGEPHADFAKLGHQIIVILLISFIIECQVFLYI